MDYWSFLHVAFFGSLHQVGLMAMIIFPLMLVLEIARDLDWLRLISNLLKPLMKLFSISEAGSIPLMAGLVFGISYGAGVIIDAAKSGELNERDMYLINIFLIICHSLFEDTGLFMVLGANGFFLVSIRLVLAILVTYTLSRWSGLGRNKRKLINHKEVKCSDV